MRLACFFVHQMKSSTELNCRRTIETRVAFLGRRIHGRVGFQGTEFYRRTKGAAHRERFVQPPALPPATEVGVANPTVQLSSIPTWSVPDRCSGSDEKRSTLKRCQDRDCKRLVQSLDVWEGGGVSGRCGSAGPPMRIVRRIGTVRKSGGWRRQSGGNDDRK